jgi:D-amino-acid oxidase
MGSVEPSDDDDVVVVGAGVSGLTTAIYLAESGRRVRVLAKDPPARTTSAMAGASWGPYLVTDPRVLRWSQLSLAELERIAGEDESGVSLVEGMEVGDAEFKVPAWATGVSGFRLCDPSELPAGYAMGWRYRIPLIDMPTYLKYLERRLLAAGATLQTDFVVERFEDVAHLAPFIVNCTGLAARALLADAELTPIRGQLVVVKNPGVSYFFQDNAEGEEITYFLPHGDTVVLGGTLNEPVGEDADPDPLVRQRIIERCAKVEPLLADPTVIEDRVGFRPARNLVRLEREGNVVHNYGHSGSGVTLSWGCAQEVLALISST